MYMCFKKATLKYVKKNPSAKIVLLLIWGGVGHVRKEINLLLEIMTLASFNTGAFSKVMLASFACFLFGMCC